MENWLLMTGGDRNAFLSIYECHYNALFSYGFSLCANTETTKDCIQEMFLEIWVKRDTINADVENIRSYLYTWLRRKIYKELGHTVSEKNTNQMLHNLDENILPYEDLLIAFQNSEEKKNKLRSALSKLTKQQLEMIRLKFFENLSYPEIATKTSLKQRTVYNLIYEAIQSLRLYMRVLVMCL